MAGTLMLDNTGDLIAAEWPGGVETVGIAIGIAQVAQSANLAVSVRKGSVWWNITAGVDYESLFHNTQDSVQLDPIRATAFREAVLSVPGISGFSKSDEITFARSAGRTVSVSIPCVDIDCDEGRATSEIQAPIKIG
jgi:hypothetical protein